MFPPRRLVCPKGEPSAGTKGHEGTCAPGSRLHDLRRLQSDDYQSSGGSATNVFNCAKVHQNIDQVATPPPRRHASQPSNPPSFLPSGYQPHRETRTRQRRMTVRFENCLGSITHQGETDGFLTNTPNDRGCHPILQFRNKICRVSPLRGTQKTQNPSPLPLYSPCPDFFRGVRVSSKNRDKDASMLF